MLIIGLHVCETEFREERSFIRYKAPPPIAKERGCCDTNDENADSPEIGPHPA